MFKRLYNIDDSMQKDMSLVKELITFERFCRDQALWEEMKKCFHPESTVSISWYKGSGAGFVEASEQSTNFAPHKINQIVVRTNQNKAVAECITSIQMRLKLQDQLCDLTSYARLHYRLTKEEGVWYVLALNGIYEKDTIEPAFGIQKTQIPNFDVIRYRESYAGLCYFLEKAGNQFYNDLPGIDRPELIEALYASSQKWLEEA